jgi:hypothetical protein
MLFDDVPPRVQVRWRVGCEALRPKDPVLKTSVSAFLPVWNREDSVSPLVAHLLEVLPDLTPRFQLVVIDDGSHDATGEIAHDLARLYPQVTMVAHPARWGRAASMRTGLSHSSSDIVLYRSETCKLGLGCLGELWHAMRTHDLALAGAASDAKLGRVPAMPGGPISGVPIGGMGAFEPDLQMVRRPVLDAWRRDAGAGADDWLAYIVHHGYRSMELAMDQPGRLAVWGRGPASWPRPVAVSRPLAAFEGVRRPNYLARLKAFALGE